MSLMRNVYCKTLYDHRIAWIAWSIGLLILGMFYAFIYPAIADSSLSSALDSLSGDFMSAFIGSAEFFASPDGFVHGEYLSVDVPFILSILAIVIAGGLLAKEEESGTIELLLSRPLGRQALVAQKIMALMTILVVLAGCAWLGLWLGSVVESSFTVTLSRMAIAIMNIGLLAAAFGSITLALTAVKSRRGLAAGVSGLYFILSYIVGTFGQQVDWLKHIEPLSLFHYVDTMATIKGQTDWWDMVVLGSVAVVLWLISFYAFSRRDVAN